ncbi:MAG: succinyl-diaminopimelate desuccinylase [Actinomycetes bacterium]
MPATRDDLVGALLEHCGVLSVTGEEAALADALEARYRAGGRPVTRVGDSLVVGAPSGDRKVVALVGHLDVVPPTDADREPRVETRDGVEVVVGRGTSDMKAGNVVAMALLDDRELAASSPYDLVLVLYAREEGPADENELADVLAAVPWLAEVDLAVVLEPTDGEVQAGCLGGIHAELVFTGRQAHSARPWHGENALTKAGAFLADLHARGPDDVEVDGIAYRDVFTATQAWTDNARNVVPGTFTVNLNYRFAPRFDVAAAERVLRDLVGDRAEVTVVDVAPPAPPRLDTPLVAALVDALGVPVTGKQAWTDLARFAELGVPAVNYGPGLTAQAHQRGEHVPVDALVDVHDRLRAFLTG